nr:CsgG/HfaB family protein [uncultured Treponema sp.]
MKKIIVTLFSMMMIFLSACGSTAVVSEAAPTTEKSSSVKETKSEKNLYKGAGLVIAVTAPEVRNGGKGESWMPQFFQDSITGNLAKYSKMTVLDRANEDLTKAEQELGETGFYTEENAVQLGQMTNAQYAVFGSITALSTSYELNFRAIDITTNEIKAAYNDRAGTKEIEDGTSVRAIITELLDGLGIGLSEKEKAQLAKTDKKSLNATKSLAKGAAAEKADNLIEALAFYAEAQENGATKKEASAGINSILGTNGTVSGNAIANLKAQLTWEKEQKEKWNKIFRDLDSYLLTKGFICVYDFSSIKNFPSYDGKRVSFEVTPGAKIVPVRKAFITANKILNEWDKVKSNPENERWTKKVNLV